MKKFLVHIVCYLGFTFAIMFLLDLGYTYLYQSAVPRTKFQLLRSLKDTKVDFPFLGSSRVDNDIIPSVIEKETGKTVVNLGFQGSKLEDIYTILSLLKSYNIQSETIFIQVDYIFNSHNRSSLMQSETIPYLKDNEVLQDYARFLPEGNALLHVPFYRYCMYEHKVGIRELTLSFIGRHSQIVEHKGYHPVYGTSLISDYELPDRILNENPAYEKILAFAKENNLKLAFFCSPFMKNTKNLDYIEKLKTKIPSLKDYSQSISQDSLFFNQAHLNHEGAKIFSEIIARETSESIDINRSK